MPPRAWRRPAHAHHPLSPEIGTPPPRQLRGSRRTSLASGPKKRPKPGVSAAIRSEALARRVVLCSVHSIPTGKPSDSSHACV
jgi:hypothetical protein